MRYFYALFIITTAVLITIRPEQTNAIIATGLAVVGLLMLLPEAR